MFHEIIKLKFYIAIIVFFQRIYSFHLMTWWTYLSPCQIVSTIFKRPEFLYPSRTFSKFLRLIHFFFPKFTAHFAVFVSGLIFFFFKFNFQNSLKSGMIQCFSKARQMLDLENSRVNLTVLQKLVAKGRHLKIQVGTCCLSSLKDSFIKS